MHRDNLNERIIYLDLMRIFSIFCMMLLHVSCNQMNYAPVSSFEWQVFNFYDSLVRFCVPAFVMISGVFFLDIKREYTIVKLFTKNIFRIITSFIFWSASYSIAYNIFKYKTINLDVFTKIVKSFVLGHYHLWFLFTLVGLYLIVPFLRKICETKVLTEYFLVLSFVFVPIVNLFMLISPLNFALILDKTNIFFVLGYSGYFVLGRYLHIYKINKKNEKIVYFLGIVSLLATIIFSAIASIQKGATYTALYDYLLPNTCFTSVAIFVLFKEKIPNLKFSEKLKSLIKSLSYLTFGMYLVHDFIIIFFTKILNFTTLSFNPVFSVPLISILIFFISWFVIYILNKIPFLNKFII